MDHEILIIQCDTPRLKADGLAVGAALHALLSLTFEAVLVEGSTLADLEDSLDAMGGATADIVVVVGHSNEEGLAAGSDAFLPWDEVARMLAPEEPSVIILLACKAGRLLPSEALFEVLDDLKDVFGWPANASASQALAVAALASQVLGTPLEEVPDVRAVQGLNALFTGRLFFHYTAEGYQDRDDGEALLMQLVEPVVGDAVRTAVAGLHDWLRRLWLRRPRPGPVAPSVVALRRRASGLDFFGPGSRHC